jgi:hypothetical protein
MRNGWLSLRIPALIIDSLALLVIAVGTFGRS